jgi:hypothetical protein
MPATIRAAYTSTALDAVNPPGYGPLMRKPTPVILAAAALLLAASPAAASQPKRLSVTRARQAIEQAAGPGTTTAACHRQTRTAVTCAFATPAANFGITFDGPPPVYEAWATAHLTRRGTTTVAFPTDA